MYFQDIIINLHQFWQGQGCLILQGYDVEEGAATLSPTSFFPALNPKPCRIAYVDPCRRPIDSRYAKFASDRLQQYYQYQIIIKPFSEDPLQIFCQSLESIGINLREVELIFKDDAWISPIFGAEGSGWEIWLNGSEIAQITYLYKVGGISCSIIPLEITYGLERFAQQLQKVNSLNDVRWNTSLTYGDLHKQAEIEGSTYCLERADINLHLQLLKLYLEETHALINCNLVYPAPDYLLKAAHSFNLIDSRRGFATSTKEDYLTKIRLFAKQIAEKYLNYCS